MNIQDNDLKSLQEYVDEMKSTSSANTKQAILRKWAVNPFICKILQYVNNPYITFGVTSKQCKKHKMTESICKPMAIIDVLDGLKTRRFTGHNALHLVNSYIANNPGYDDLIYSIIDRDLETRANTTLINKVMPGFIPVFKVALAQPYEEKRADFENEEWYASRKLDGVRCICRIDHQGEIQFYSRNGKRFDTLGTLKVNMYQLGLKDIIFDGEICIVEDGVENFASVMKEIKKKNHTIKNPKFFIFDCLTPVEFESGTSSTPLLTRLGRIPKMKDCVILPQVKINSKKDLLAMHEEYLKKGYEGTMVRNNMYKGKRSYDLMKVKHFIDAEYTVTNTVNGNMRFFEDGVDVERETMASVIIRHKGSDVGVGSGFSKEQREFYYKYPDEIIGKVITVQYFEELVTSDGGYSLRFPTLKVVHGPERTV
jgi:DNA ligase-1